MPREPQTGVCSICGQTKPLFDVKNKRCGSCAGKRGGGKPKALKVKEKPANPFPPANVPATPARKEKPAVTTVAGDSEKYLCESCGGELRYGQRKCRCGVWADWRGTPIETDPDLVMCPECGAICGHEGNATVCPHCNYGG